MTTATTTAIKTEIDRYEAGASDLHRWIDGLSPADLDAHPVANTWSMRQLVVHMLDSDLAYGHRMRKITAEQKPLLMGYDETAWSSVPAMQVGDLKVVASLFEAHRQWVAAFLHALPEDAWQREGVHSERGIVTISKLIGNMIGHVTHHEPFVVAKRAALGKPMRELVSAAR